VYKDLGGKFRKYVKDRIIDKDFFIFIELLVTQFCV